MSNVTKSAPKRERASNGGTLSTLPNDTELRQNLPTAFPAAVYIRRSPTGKAPSPTTEEDLWQAAALIQNLEGLGWQRSDIIVVEPDLQVSGTTSMHERQGMTQLLSLIEQERIRLVTVSNVDRLFRDAKQIEANQFIELCYQHRVQILTPDFTYDFAHPMVGAEHRKLFRLEVAKAADYVSSHVIARLRKARERLSELGFWGGACIPTGYMVDLRSLTPDGISNPGWRRFKIFPAHAQVVARYFQLVAEFSCDLSAAWRHIEAHGPYFDHYDSLQVPNGHHLSRNLRIVNAAGQLKISQRGFSNLFTNPVYGGHWAVKGVVLKFEHYDPIVPPELFNFVFSRISRYTLLGEINAQCTMQRNAKLYPQQLELDKVKNSLVYLGVAYSADVTDALGQPALLAMDNPGKRQHYQVHQLKIVHGKSKRRASWSAAATIIDPAIDRLILDRLKILRLQVLAATDLKTATSLTRFNTEGIMSWSVPDDHMQTGHYDRHTDVLSAAVAAAAVTARTKSESSATEASQPLSSLSPLPLPLPLPLDEQNGKGSRTRLRRDSARDTGQPSAGAEAASAGATQPICEQDCRRLAAHLMRLGYTTSSPTEWRALPLLLLQRVIEQWAHLPGSAHRLVFDGLALKVLISRMEAGTYRVTVHWRDGSIAEGMAQKPRFNTSLRPTQQLELVTLVDQGATQEQILATFPDFSWFELSQQYRRRAKRPWKGAFRGDLNYPGYARWTDILAGTVGTKALERDRQRREVASLTLKCPNCGRTGHQQELCDRKRGRFRHCLSCNHKYHAEKGTEGGLE